MVYQEHISTALSLKIINQPFFICRSSGHSFPPLRGGLVIILCLYTVPVGSGLDHSDQSLTIHGNGTENNIKVL